MVMPRPFKEDDVLFRQGDASDRVLRVRSGEIEILPKVGAASVLLGHPRMDNVGGEKVTLSLVARSDTLRARLGAAPIPVAHLPFVVGRPPLADEAQPWRRPDLLIEDEEPFRLSSDHFAIMRGTGGLAIADLGSTLGTIVNGQATGHQFTKDAAPLRRGENLVVAGGWDSPLRLHLICRLRPIQSSRT